MHCHFFRYGFGLLSDWVWLLLSFFEFWDGDFMGNGSTMQDLHNILSIIQTVLQYPFHVFGFYITLEGTLIGSEVVSLAISALWSVFEWLFCILYFLFWLSLFYIVVLRIDFYENITFSGSTSYIHFDFVDEGIKMSVVYLILLILIITLHL